MKKLLSILSALVIGATGSSLATVANTTHDTNHSQIVQKAGNGIFDQVAASIVGQVLQGVPVNGSNLIAGMPVGPLSVLDDLRNNLLPVLNTITGIVPPQLAEIIEAINLDTLMPQNPIQKLVAGNNIVPFSLDVGTAKALFDVVVSNVPGII